MERLRGYFVFLIGLVWLLLMGGCGTVSTFPPPKPGMVVAGNKSPAKREIRVLAKRCSLRQLKRVDDFGNEVLAVPPLQLLWIGQERGWIWKSRELIFKSEEIAAPDETGMFVSKFTIPCSYRVGSQMASKSAVLYLKPETCYTFYGRDYGLSGEFLGEWIRNVCTSNSGTRDRRKTYTGVIWADRIIDLPRPDTRGPRRLRFEYFIDPWH